MFPDANMNVTAVVKEVDTENHIWDVVERYMYDAYGKVTILHGAEDVDGTDTTDDECTPRPAADSFANEILYCGYRFDPDTGLYHVRFRVYHPTLGRWLQRDPLGYADGMNLYQYVRSGPAHRLDPLGLTGNASYGDTLSVRDHPDWPGEGWVYEVVPEISVGDQWIYAGRRPPGPAGAPRPAPPYQPLSAEQLRRLRAARQAAIDRRRYLAAQLIYLNEVHGYGVEMFETAEVWRRLGCPISFIIRGVFGLDHGLHAPDLQALCQATWEATEEWAEDEMRRARLRRLDVAAVRNMSAMAYYFYHAYFRRMGRFPPDYTVRYGEGPSLGRLSRLGLSLLWALTGVLADSQQGQRLENLLDIDRTYVEVDWQWRMETAQIQGIQEVLQRDQSEHLQTGQ